MNVDVVFVHGLLGGPFKTWRQDDQMRNTLDTDDSYTYFWPKVAFFTYRNSSSLCYSLTCKITLAAFV